MYVRDVVFTTGIADAGDYYVVASGEAEQLRQDPRVLAAYLGAGDRYREAMTDT